MRLWTTATPRYPPGAAAPPPSPAGTGSLLVSPASRRRSVLRFRSARWFRRTARRAGFGGRARFAGFGGRARSARRGAFAAGRFGAGFTRAFFGRAGGRRRRGRFVRRGRLQRGRRPREVRAGVRAEELQAADRDETHAELLGLGLDPAAGGEFGVFDAERSVLALQGALALERAADPRVESQQAELQRDDPDQRERHDADPHAAADQAVEQPVAGERVEPAGEADQPEREPPLRGALRPGSGRGAPDGARDPAGPRRARRCGGAEAQRGRARRREASRVLRTLLGGDLARGAQAAG